MAKIWTFFLAGPTREIQSGQDGPILPARVANQNAGFASVILHAREFSHTIKTVLNSTKWKKSSLSVYFLSECRFFIMFFFYPLTYVIVVNICLFSIWKISAVVIIIWNTITIPRNTKSPPPQKGSLLPEWLRRHSHQVNTLKGTWCYDRLSSNMISYWLNNK